MTTEHIWGAEYRARFDDDSGQVFRGIRAALARDPYPQAIAGRLYVAGVDWGRDRDYTVIVIIDADERRMVALDRFNQIGWGLQRGRLRAICDRWQLNRSGRKPTASDRPISKPCWKKDCRCAASRPPQRANRP
ncbi:MAG: hypothetical protein OXG39_16720 [Chloroflexi bacterium]|nr:hypothetical protein [Chloroflexota bacterium]